MLCWAGVLDLPEGEFHLVRDTLNGTLIEGAKTFYHAKASSVPSVVGLVVGTLMSIITEYYTAMGKRPVLSIVRQSGTGHATNVIGGLAMGMESTFLPMLVLAAGIWGSYQCAGLYGVGIAAAGMMATTAMQLAIDAFGLLPITPVVLLK